MKNKALLIVLLNITEKYLEIDNYRFEGKLKFTPGSEVKLTGDESVYAWFNVPHNARVLKITAFPIEENVEKDPVVEKVELKEGENSSGSDNVPDIDILSALGENTLPEQEDTNEQEELNPEQEDTNEQEEVEEEVKKVITKKTTKNVLKSRK